MAKILEKSWEKKSTLTDPIQRVPVLVRGDMEDAAEHGLGAEPSIGRRFRVRPLKRFEAAQAAN